MPKNGGIESKYICTHMLEYINKNFKIGEKVKKNQEMLKYAQKVNNFFIMGKKLKYVEIY